MIVRSSGGVGKREGRRSSIANRRDTHENRSDAHHYGGASGSPQNRHYPYLRAQAQRIVPCNL